MTSSPLTGKRHLDYDGLNGLPVVPMCEPLPYAVRRTAALKVITRFQGADRAELLAMLDLEDVA